MKWGGNPEASLWSFFTDVRSDLSSAIFLSQHNVQRETRNRSEACNAVPWHRLVVGGSISDCSEDARFAMSTGSMCRISFRVHFEFRFQLRFYDSQSRSMCCDKIFSRT